LDMLCDQMDWKKGMMLIYEEERRRRGRPSRRWMDEIHEVTGMKLVELRHDDRKETMEKACHVGH